MPPRAYQLFAEGKALGTDFNGPRRQEGIEKLQELVNTYPKYAVGYGELAASYREQFRTSRDPAILALARANARHALTLNSDSGIALLSSAEVATDSGHPDEALAYLEKILARDPHDPDALMFRATVYREKNDAAGEKRAFRQILESRPNYWRAYNDLGRFQTREGDYTGAIESFTMATRVAPNVCLPLTNLASLYQLTGKAEQAQEAFEKSISIFPTADAYTGLGNLALSAKKYQQALTVYQSALKLEPRNHDLYHDVGDCQTMLGQTEASKESFRKASELLSEELKINPTDGSDWMVLSLYHAKIGAKEEALADIARADKRDATDGGSLLMKAQTYAVLGYKEEASKFIQRSLLRGTTAEEIDMAIDLRGIPFKASSDK